MTDNEPASRPPVSNADLAVKLHECVYLFLDEVARDTDGPAHQGIDSILCPLAEILRGLFQNESLLVIWRSEGRALGAQAFRPGDAASARCTVAAQEELTLIQRLQVREDPSSAFRIRQYLQAGAVRALCLSTGDAPAASELWILCQTEEPGDVWRWFAGYTSGLRSLYSTVNAILRAQVATSEHRAALRSRVITLLNTPSVNSMPESVELLRQLLRGGASDLDIFQDVAVFLLQHALGAGWRVRSKPEVLFDAANLCHTALNRGGDRDLIPLRCALRCLRMLQRPSEPDVGHLENPQFDLLPLWTQMHEQWRPYCEAPYVVPPVYDDAWRAAVDRTLPQLAKHLSQLNERLRALAESSQGASAGQSMPSVRNLLHLWFCLHMLTAERTISARMFARERNLLRAELAYVLRESLRFACFGERPDYFFHAPTFTAALQVLIARHAHDVVGLPSGCAVGTLLNSIAKDGGVNQVFAAEHFQHVTEIYIAGHYMLSLRLDAQAAAEERRYMHGWTLAEALMGAEHSYPDKAAVRSCLQAFSLAALFHDVDHLFLPASAARQTMALGDETLLLSLDRLSDARHEAVKKEAQGWVAELLSAGYLGSEDQKLRTWMEGMPQQCSPHHGVLSAWCLHRLGVAQDKDFQRSLRMAVRAVLMHYAIAVQIQADHDPVAVLLLLCDEVFEWDPSMQTAPTETGRNLQMMGTALSPHILRDRCIRLRSVIMNERSAEACLTLPASSSDSWPILDLTLADPEQLDLPVFRLWLRKSRNLGRVQRGASGLGPTIVVRSRVSCLMQRLGLTNASLLEELADRVSPDYQDALHEWVLEVLTSRNSPGTAEDEYVSVGPLSASRIFELDFRRCRSELEQKAEDLISERRAAASQETWIRPEGPLPPPIPDNRSVRDRMDRVLRTDSDLTAFCLDHFPSVHHRFPNQMDRVAKYNLLLELVDSVRVSAELDIWEDGRPRDG